MAVAAFSKRYFPGQRWISVVLRTMHLACVVLIAAPLLRSGDYNDNAGVLLLGTGLALFALELWSDPGHWRDLAGVIVIVKLALVMTMVSVPAYGIPIFWTLMIVSCTISHAPRRCRHWRPTLRPAGKRLALPGGGMACRPSHRA